MIFRTGSILIVGKCDEEILNYVYNYIKSILLDEYHNISTGNIDINELTKTPKTTKFKKKFIYVS